MGGRMKERELDLVVFGATGFTGTYILKQVLATAKPGLRVGAAGRNERKINAVLEKLGGNSSSVVTVVVCDVNDPQSLRAMASRTRLVINAVGPYRHYGEQVVKACVEESTHHLDICGEPEFIEKTELSFGGKSGLAAKNGCFVVSAVGFDSVPCDLGVIHNQQCSVERGMVPCSVESFLSVKSGGAGMVAHYATWEALVLGFASAGKLRGIRRDLRAREEAEASGAAGATPMPAGPRPKRVQGASYDERVAAYALPFLGSDASVVRRSQRALASRGKVSGEKFHPVHHSALFTVQSKYTVGLFALFGGLLKQLVKSSWGRGLLLRYPSWFSWGMFAHEGPTEEQMKETSFEFIFHGKSFSSQR